GQDGTHSRPGRDGTDLDAGAGDPRRVAPVQDQRVPLGGQTDSERLPEPVGRSGDEDGGHVRRPSAKNATTSSTVESLASGRAARNGAFQNEPVRARNGPTYAYGSSRNASPSDTP